MSLNNKCKLCDRLRGEPDITLTSMININNDELIISEKYSENVDWLCDERTMIKRQYSWRSLNKCRTTKCASSVVRWRCCGGKITWPSFIWIAIILFSVIAAGLAEMTIPSIGRYTNSSRGEARTRELNPTPAVAASADVAAVDCGGVCQSIDIRNSVNQFSRLKGCRVVEGFVQILLIDHADDSAYSNLTFPDLVEITGYLLLYRVNGLRSLGRLFPNLTVIRGHSLFINYALVAFEMMHLQEIGLHSLTDILRGSVRFEKNPALCYVDTIDWDMIARADKGEHNVISSNKPKNGCPVCDKKCPIRLDKSDDTLCWNRQHCQKVCDKKCGDRACSPSGECCHSSCLGGCSGPTAQNCTVCREVTVVENQCIKRCPTGTYEFMNRRCIQENECRKMRKPLEVLGNVRDYPYKPFNHSCVIECPAGYMDEEKDGKASCKKCDGPCLKECSGASVDSIATAQKLRGCTHIKGSLEIQIRGGKNMVKELEDNLNMIEEIDGYLKIVRSFPLISLNFLKSLRVIRGNDLENGKYTLAVLDNQNLQELWDWETHQPIKLYSKNGSAKVFFHFNPKLCLQKIKNLRDHAGLQEFSDLEVAPNSNGDKVACNVTELKAEVIKKTSEAAIIQWETFTHHDLRSLLGYVIYFIEAPNQNVTIYDGRDACGGDGWKVDDVPAEFSDSGGQLIATPLTRLKPYTQYAFYIKTYTIATERSGAQSKVNYFTTMPGTPTPPRALSIWSNSSNELVMSWSPPLRKNGNLTHYLVISTWEQDDQHLIAQRNYCDEPLQLPEKKPIAVMAEEERQRAKAEMARAVQPEVVTCECADFKTDPSIREKEVSSSIAFEDALHNQVYIRKGSGTRKKRDSNENLPDIPPEKNHNFFSPYHTKESDEKNETTIKQLISANNTNSTHRVQYTVPSNELTFVMRNLRHFALYNIEIQSCREGTPDEAEPYYCSSKTMRSYITLPYEHADDIPSGSFKLVKINGNNSRPIVQLQWDEPPQPNGLIVTYQIEYKRVDIKNMQATVLCITRQDFVNNDYSYTLKDLPSGNYSIKIRATSLAGSGSDSEIVYVYIDEYSTRGTFWMVFWSITSIVLLIISLGTFYICKRKLMRNVPSMRLIATVNPEYVSTVYVPDEWEVPRKKIRVIRELGNGSFGMVYEGIAKDINKSNPEIRCAVKTVNENATDRERIEFLNEASVMKAFNTHHVVRLLGVVSRGQPTLVVMELMVNGDLKTYLRSHRPDQCENLSTQPPTLKRILRMAVEIADGMAYLAAKKFVHRDLAARNCMVAEDLTVKIGDFGMTRDIYETDYYRKGTKGLLPVRWMAPESLKDGLFTSYSDVWSYGVVLWEMVTLASQPYQGLSNDQVLRYVIDGGVMERPENCPDSLYILMRRTWNQKVTRRPTFIDIATILLQEADLDGFEKVSFYHSPDGIEARNQNNSNSPQNDKDFELAMLEDLREEEREGDDEDSPLRGDFDDFASIEPVCLKNSSDSRYCIELYGENSKIVANFHDLNSSKIPLKAGFDDFDGVSAGSLCSSKDTLNFPFVEDSLKSVKNSPSIKNNSTPQTRSNISPKSGNNSISPQNKVDQAIIKNRGRNKLQKNSPDYENRSPEVTSNNDGMDVVSMRIDFPSIDNVIVDTPIEVCDKQPQTEYSDKSETLNNGYISGKATT
ncbi:hypothetical protein PV326_004167 [Microctonus aethiopoides]|nr:hypothetical protein PV326_004167 [Microctonus aethiopoides]